LTHNSFARFCTEFNKLQKVTRGRLASCKRNCPALKVARRWVTVATRRLRGGLTSCKRNRRPLKVATRWLTVVARWLKAPTSAHCHVAAKGKGAEVAPKSIPDTHSP